MMMGSPTTVPGPLVFQQVYDLQNGSTNSITSATVSGTTVTITVKPFNPINPKIGNTVVVTGMLGNGLIGYNGTFIITGGSSASGTIQYTNQTGGIPSFKTVTSGTFTKNSITITNLTTTTGIVVGQFLTSTDPNLNNVLVYTINGVYVTAILDSSTVQISQPFPNSGYTNSPITFSSNALATIVDCYVLSDANGNSPVQNTAFSAAVQVQGGYPPYNYSFYQPPLATTTASSNYTGVPINFWTTGTTVPAIPQNVWTINSSTGMVSGTPGVTEGNLLYVQVRDSQGQTIQSRFALGVSPSGVGTGLTSSTYYKTSLRPWFFPAIPAWITGTSVGLAAPNDLSAVGPLRLPAGKQTVTALNTGLARSITIQNTNSNAVDGGYTNGQQYVCTASNCYYTLTCDLTSPTWCINIPLSVSNIVIDLNGHTVTYGTSNTFATGDNSAEAYGIGGYGSYQYNGFIEIINGTIRNGAGRSTNMRQGLYGTGPSPIKFYAYYMFLQLRGLYFYWNTYSCGAICDAQCVLLTDNQNTKGTPYPYTSMIEYCTFEDHGWTVQDRQFQANIVGQEGWPIIRWNRFISGRDVAINGISANVYENEFWHDTWWTNGSIMPLIGSSSATWISTTSGRLVVPYSQKIYNNNMYFTGCHPQSCFMNVSSPAGQPTTVYHNWFEGMYTRIGNQFPSPTGQLDDYENYADGFTMKFGNPQNNTISTNTIWTHAMQGTVFNPVSNSYQNSTARGLYYQGATNTVTNNTYNSNLFAATGVDATALCYVLGLSNNGTGLSFTGNRLITNRVHFWIGDVYGYDVGTGGATLQNNNIEIQGTPLNYAAFRNDAYVGTIINPITSVKVSGNTVTVGYTKGSFLPGYLATVNISGITGGTGFNGVFQGTATILHVGSTDLTYVSTTTGTPSQTGTLNSNVPTYATFLGNNWVNGSWSGSTVTQAYQVVQGATGGASGTVPVIYSNLGPAGAYYFYNEPLSINGSSGVNPTPSVSSIVPLTAIAGASGATLTISGTGFVAGSLVYYNSSSLAINVNTSTQIQATIPAGQLSNAATATVTVVNPSPGGGTSNGTIFTVVAVNPVPSISSINPSTVVAGTSTTIITLTGNGYVSSSTVQVNGSNIPSTYVGNSLFTATLASLLLTNVAALAITVTNPAPGGGVSAASVFNVTTSTIPSGNPFPSISQVSPSIITTSSNSINLTLFGSGFIPGSQIYANATLLTATTYVSSSTLNCVLPSSFVAQPNTISLDVVNPAPGGGTSLFAFVVVANNNPTIRQMSQYNGYYPQGGAISSNWNVTLNNVQAGSTLYVVGTWPNYYSLYPTMTATDGVNNYNFLGRYDDLVGLNLGIQGTQSVGHWAASNVSSGTYTVNMAPTSGAFEDWVAFSVFEITGVAANPVVASAINLQRNVPSGTNTNAISVTVSNNTLTSNLSNNGLFVAVTFDEVDATVPTTPTPGTGFTGLTLSSSTTFFQGTASVTAPLINGAMWNFYYKPNQNAATAEYKSVGTVGTFTATFNPIEGGAQNPSYLTLGAIFSALVQNNPPSNLVHGQLASVSAPSGINFGTRANYNFGNYSWKGYNHMHLVWAQMDQGLPTTYTDADWNRVLGGMTAFYSNSTKHITCPPFTATIWNGFPFTGFGLVAGGVSQSGYYFQRGMGNPTMYTDRYCGGLVVSVNGITTASYTGEYLSYKFQSQGGVNNVISDQKRTRRSYHFGSNNDTETILTDSTNFTQKPYNNAAGFIMPGGLTGATNLNWPGYNNASNVSGSLSTSTSNQVPDVTQWNRWEHAVKWRVGSTGTVLSRVNGNAATGAGTLYFGNSTIKPPLSVLPAIDPAGLLDINPVWNAPYTDASGNQNNAGMTLGSEMDSSAYLGKLFNVNGQNQVYFTNPYTANFADIYYDFTAARVEISDGTYSEPQCLVSWSGTAISYVFNQGQLSTGTNRTLYVYDQNERVIYSTPVNILSTASMTLLAHNQTFVITSTATGMTFTNKLLSSPVAWDNGSINSVLTATWTDAALPDLSDPVIAANTSAAMAYRAVPFVRPPINYPAGTVDTPTTIYGPNNRVQNIIGGLGIGSGNRGYDQLLSVKYPYLGVPHTLMATWWERADPYWSSSSGISNGSYVGLVFANTSTVNFVSSSALPSGYTTGSYIVSNLFPSGTTITNIAISGSTATLTLSNKALNNGTNAVLYQATFGGQITYNSSTITNCSQFIFANPGLYISNSNGYFPQNTYITNINQAAGTVTVSSTASSSSAGTVGILTSDNNYKYFGVYNNSFYNNQGGTGFYFAYATPFNGQYSTTTSWTVNDESYPNPSLTLPGSAYGTPIPSQSTTLSGWSQKTVYIKFTGAGGTIVAYDGDSLTNYLPVITSATNLNTQSTAVMLGGYNRTPLNSNSWRYFANCFVDVGDGDIYLTDNTSWSNSTIREIQPWINWTSTSITIQVNGGRFEDGRAVYLHYRLPPWSRQGDSAILGPFQMTSVASPVINNLSPSNALQGSTTATVTVNGSNFVSNSVVRINGVPVTTNFASTNKLTFALPTSSLSSATVLNITVLSPGLGGGISSAVPLYINGISTKVSGNTLVDQNGNFVQLRGANFSSLAFAPVSALTTATANYVSQWGGQIPDWSVFQTWKPNVARISLNAAAWLGLTTYNQNNGAWANSFNCDYWGNYKQTVYTAIAAAQAVGCYVILDLHCSAPSITLGGVTHLLTPTGKSEFMNTNTDLSFWISMAQTFGTNNPSPYPGITNAAVLFEIFNEPYLDINGSVSTATAYSLMLQGGSFPPNLPFGVDVDNGISIISSTSIGILGYTQVVNAIRANGANNVCIINGAYRTQSAQNYTSWFPTDSLSTGTSGSQLAHGWHAYPVGNPQSAYPYTITGSIYGKTGTDDTSQGWDHWYQQILNAGIPVLITEDGGLGGTSASQGEPHITFMENWSDQNNVSYIASQYTANQNYNIASCQYYLTQYATAANTSPPSVVPIQGAGVAVYNWTKNHVNPTAPTPRLLSMSPTQTASTLSSITLTVTGTNFTSNSVINWNGVALPTFFGSSTGLTATVTATNLINPGSFPVTVSTPGATTVSLPLTFTVSGNVYSSYYLSRLSAAVGSPDITVTLQSIPGTVFPSYRGVTWNGSGDTLDQSHSLSSTQISPTQIQAIIPAHLLSVPNAAPISVDIQVGAYGIGQIPQIYPIQTFVAQPVTTASLTVKVASSGGIFVDANNNYLQLRGVNLGGLQYAVRNNNEIIWEGIVPRYAVLAKWKCSIVRIPMNAGSWLGITCWDVDTTVRNSQGFFTQWANAPSRNADLYGSTRAATIAAVQAAQALGCRVILEIHWSAPYLTLTDPVTGTPSRRLATPIGQSAFMNADTDLDFWKSIANTFGTQAPPVAPGIQNDGIIFEIFNEPYLDSNSSNQPFVRNLMLNGGSWPANTQWGYDIDTAATVVSQAPINVLGYQQVIDAIRTTGAQNVCVINGPTFTQQAQNYKGWFPTDKILVGGNLQVASNPQLAHGWHAYPGGGFPTQSYPYTADPSWIYGKTGGDAYQGTSNFDYWYKQLQAANIPVIMTEDGGLIGPQATQGEPHIDFMTKWADQNNASYVAWNWTSPQNPAYNVNFGLTQYDASGNYIPGQGAGVAVYNWLTNHTTATVPTPQLLGISPTNIAHGSTNITLTVTGKFFVSGPPGTTVNWNGVALSTTYNSSTQVTAVIPSTYLASAGTAAITLTSPGAVYPSTTSTFTIN